MQIFKVKETDSTNNWILRNEETLPEEGLVYCFNQSAGRGQRGNSWESEPGKNLTASIFFHPQNFPACQQFVISEAIALAIVEFLASKGIEAKVKWPNDIYVGEKKICGILVEHKILGKDIVRTIGGFGLNLNQTEFISGAPNPISLKMLTGGDYSVDKTAEEIAEILEIYLSRIKEQESIHKLFKEKLWRGDGKKYSFFDRKENKLIEAIVHNVNMDGMLELVTSDGDIKTYYFKEVEFIL